LALPGFRVGIAEESRQIVEHASVVILRQGMVQLGSPAGLSGIT
jgi:hypothetical protein